MVEEMLLQTYVTRAEQAMRELRWELLARDAEAADGSSDGSDEMYDEGLAGLAA